MNVPWYRGFFVSFPTLLYSGYCSGGMGLTRWFASRVSGWSCWLGMKGMKVGGLWNGMVWVSNGVAGDVEGVSDGCVGYCRVDLAADHTAYLIG